MRLASRKILDISALESGARLLNTVALMHVLVTFFRGRRQTIYPDLYSTYTLTQRLFPIASYRISNAVALLSLLASYGIFALYHKKLKTVAFH